MRAYYINVDTAVERRERFEATTAAAVLAAGVPIERVSAVTPAGLPAWERESGQTVGLLARKAIREGIPVEPAVVDSIESVACSASHTRAWRRFMGSGAKWGVFFEDDALVQSECERANLARALAQIRDTDHPFSVVLLGWTPYPHNSFPPADRGPWLDVNRDGPKWWTGAHAYVASREAVQTLAQRFRTVDLYPDTLLMMCGNEGEVRVGATNYLFLRQRGKSTLSHVGSKYERATIAVAALSGTLVAVLLAAAVTTTVLSVRLSRTRREARRRNLYK